MIHLHSETDFMTQEELDEYYRENNLGDNVIWIEVPE